MPAQASSYLEPLKAVISEPQSRGKDLHGYRDHLGEDSNFLHPVNPDSNVKCYVPKTRPLLDGDVLQIPSLSYALLCFPPLTIYFRFLLAPL